MLVTKLYLCENQLIEIIMKKSLLLAILPFFLFACKSDDEPSVKTNYEINCGETVEVDGDGEIKVENEYIAMSNNHKILGFHVGETSGVYNGKTKVSIKVNSVVNYIDYPITEWGISQSQVQSKHKGGTLVNSTSAGLLYTIKSGTKQKYEYLYVFENDKLKGASVIVPYTEASRSADWLSERYILIMTGDEKVFSGGFDALKPEDAKTLVAVSLQNMNTSVYITSYSLMIVFAPYSNTRAGSIENEQELINEFKQLLDSKMIEE